MLVRRNFGIMTLCVLGSRLGGSMLFCLGRPTFQTILCWKEILLKAIGSFVMAGSSVSVL